MTNFPTINYQLILHSTQCDFRKLLYPKNIIFLKYNNCKDYIIYNLGHIILEKTVSVWYNSEKILYLQNIIFHLWNFGTGK